VSREMGEVAQKLLLNYDKYDTGKEAAIALGVSSPRIYVLCQKLGIRKWSQDHPKKAKLTQFVCETCGQTFSRKRAELFCSRKCLGSYAGKNYGFKKSLDVSEDVEHPGHDRSGLKLISHDIKDNH
jgi:transposase-like protein